MEEVHTVIRVPHLREAGACGSHVLGDDKGHD